MEKWISSFVVSVRLESSEIAWDGNRQHHSCYTLDISICECIGFKDLYTEKADGGGGRSSPAAHLPFPPRRVDDVRRAGSLDSAGTSPDPVTKLVDMKNTKKPQIQEPK